MKIYKHRIFANWAKDETIDNDTLKKAIREIERGLFEANLGGHVYKKRIARKGQGKRSGYRTIIAFKQDDKAIFILGFAKNDLENITDQQLAFLKKLSHYYFTASKAVIEQAIVDKDLTEVT